MTERAHTAPTALITGASQGLGRVLAKCFWASGYSLILVARRHEALESLAKELTLSLTDKHSSTIINASTRNSTRNSTGSGSTITTSVDKPPSQGITIYSCDLANTSSLDDLIKTLYTKHDRLDVLINNAALQGPVGPSTVAWDTNPLVYRETIQVNLLAPIEIASRLVPLMSQTARAAHLSHACIINISGGGATGPRANFSAYAASKAGLVRFSETLAEEVRGLGVTVNCIAPGAMKTGMTLEVLEKGLELAGDKEFASAQKVQLEGGVSMERVAELALFLASAQAKGITGKLISANWDNWRELVGQPSRLEALSNSDLFTLRRIAGRDRDMPWADL